MTDPSDPIAAHLPAWRERFAEGGPRALEGAEPLPKDTFEAGPPADDGAGQGRYYELMAYDALALRRPGWAFVCLRASRVGYDAAELAGDGEQVGRQAQQVLETWFPPYASDGELIADVQRWLWARGVEVCAVPDVEHLVGRREGPLRERPDPVQSEAMALKHRWLFRLMRSYQVGRGFRIDAVLSRFPLRNEDQILLRVLLAAHGDRVFEHVVGRGARQARPMTVGLLVEMLADDATDRRTWRRRFDGRAPLRRFGLVHVAPPDDLEQPLHDRFVDVDESVLAAVEGRDYWPAELDDLAALHTAAPAVVPAHVEAAAAALAALDASGAPAPLLARSRAVAREVALTWSALQGSGEVVEVLGPVPASAGARRALARQARLRNAVVLAGDPSDPDRVAQLAALLQRPLLWHQEPGRAWPGAVEVRPPGGADAVRQWNTALAEHGMAELGPDAVTEHLLPLGLDHADIVEVARAASRAGPKMSASELAAVAGRLVR